MIIRKVETIQDEIEGRNLKIVTEDEQGFSHLVFAGSDIMLCINFHDPLLHVLVKALRYGTIPIQVNRKTAGSSDSTFGNMSLRQALDLVKKNPKLWNLKIMEAMEKDLCCEIHVSAYTSIKNL